MSGEPAQVKVAEISQVVDSNVEQAPEPRSWFRYTYTALVRYQFVIGVAVGVALGSMATVTGQALYAAQENKKCVF